MITGFNHTSFTVSDIDKSVRFWTEMLGFKAASVSPREGDWQETVTGVPGASLMVAHLYGHGHHIEFDSSTCGVQAMVPRRNPLWPARRMSASKSTTSPGPGANSWGRARRAKGELPV